MEEDAELDLIVVGTKDGLTMVEAGADEVPEEMLEAFELAHQEIVKICEAQEARRQIGKPKWLDPGVYRRAERDHGSGSRRPSVPTACARRPPRSRRSKPRSLPSWA